MLTVARLYVTTRFVIEKKYFENTTDFIITNNDNFLILMNINHSIIYFIATKQLENRK